MSDCKYDRIGDNNRRRDCDCDKRCDNDRDCDKRCDDDRDCDRHCNRDCDKHKDCGTNFREAVCIHTDKIYDSCRDKDCARYISMLKRSFQSKSNRVK